MGKKNILKGSVALLLTALIASSGSAVLAADAKEITTENPYENAAPGVSYDVTITKFEIYSTGTANLNVGTPICFDIIVEGAQKENDSYNSAFVDILDENNNKVTRLTYNDEPITWTPTIAGTYTADFQICDYYGATASQQKTFEVTDPLSVELTVPLTGSEYPIKTDTVTLVAQANGGRERYEYAFTCVYTDDNGNTVSTKLTDFKPDNSIDYTFNETGTYIFTVTARDGYDTKVSAPITQRITLGFFISAYAEPSTPTVNQEVKLHSNAIGMGNHEYTTRYDITDPDGNTTTINTEKFIDAVWTPKKAGKYEITVTPVWNNTDNISKTFSVDVTESDLDVILETEQSTVPVGQKASVFVYCKGGTGKCTVSSVRYHYLANTSYYSYPLQKISDTEYTFTPDQSGPYEIIATIQDSLGNTATNKINIIANIFSIGSFKANRSELLVGETVTLTTNASGSSGNISIINTINDGTTLSVKRSNPKTYVSKWTPSKAGSYTVTTSLLYYDKVIDTKELTITVNDSQTTPISNGTVILYYKGYAAPKIEYQTDSEEWSDPASMTKITTEFGATHKYTIDLGTAKIAVVRFSNGKGGVDDLDGENYSFTKGLYFYNNGLISEVTGQEMLKSNTLVSNPTLGKKNEIAVSGVVLGKSLKVTCAATGGTGNYEYAVLYRKITSEKWVQSQDYNSNDTVFVKPAALGKYVICVKTRDGSGIVQKKYFVISVVEEPKLVVNLSELEIKLHDSTLVNCSAAGGSGRFVYGAWYKKSYSDKYHTFQSYKSNGAINLTPAAATEYDICVKVKDLVTGETVGEYFKLLVKK